MKVALVCIARDEEHYIKEWVSYHQLLKFDQIFIYDNGNNWLFSSETLDVFNSNDVTILPFPGEYKQYDAYHNFIENYKHAYDWVVFIDCDEFIVLKKNESIQEFIAEYNGGYDSIALITYFFGSNGHTSIVDNNYSVLNRFTKKKETGTVPPWLIKVCLNLKSNKHIVMETPHNSNLISVDTSGRTFAGPYAPYVDRAVNDVVQLNHYFLKSKEEFSRKIEKGRADCAVKRTMEEFYVNDVNEIEDLFALEFYKSKIGNL